MSFIENRSKDETKKSKLIIYASCWNCFADGRWQKIFFLWERKQSTFINYEILQMAE